MLTGAQIRAARALLDMSIADLARLAGLAVNTVRRAEGTNDIPRLTNANMKLLRSALEEAGVDFIEADDFGPGVRFRSPKHGPSRLSER